MNKLNIIPTCNISRLMVQKYELDQRKLSAISIGEEKPLGETLVQFHYVQSR